MSLASFAVFDTQPSDEFVSAWIAHISETGYPETFGNVTTTHPPRDGKVVLLSSDIKVPVLRREGQEWVPCPICSPTGKKFKVGRCAWFPGEKAVRFIGHKCAARHFGELYAEAEERFKVEARCRQLVAAWASLLDRREALLDLIDEARPIAEALYFVREQIDDQAPGFSDFLYTDLAKRQGELSIKNDTGLRDQKGQVILETVVLGQVYGYVFLKRGFAPQNVLREARAFLATMDTPLPPWSPGSTDDSATLEVLARGGQAIKMMSAVRDTVSLIDTAQRFFGNFTLALLERWGRNEQSPFRSLTFTRSDKQILLRSVSFAGEHYANALVPDAALASLPYRANALDPLTSERPI
ncbi:MAG: hypothetical protein EOQ55_00785 [Mesorhizobium sp.]|uniref:hypothetical protein n=2 Tax=Mesorhizobium sp. TaxID=1871066 RepID=UPI000FE99E01|nr:hypothetical protein [Mesorhizobium sp.]RWG23324.1 MAG: hypothetical protein EOQ55_00785 [Mesorhizobium sp.]RWG60479.1 MAG: hypothetical protein EOQ64_01490 [Mesorhizobium sp.]